MANISLDITTTVVLLLSFVQVLTSSANLTQNKEFSKSSSMALRYGRYLTAQCGNIRTRDWPMRRGSLEHRRKGRLLDAVVSKSGAAVINAPPPTFLGLSGIAFYDSKLNWANQIKPHTKLRKIVRTKNITHLKHSHKPIRRNKHLKVVKLLANSTRSAMHNNGTATKLPKPKFSIFTGRSNQYY